MYPFDESHDERLERQRREHEKFMKQLRRERYSFFVLLGAWGVYMCVIPFVFSPDRIMLMLGILLLFFGQFLVVMALD